MSAPIVRFDSGIKQPSAPIVKSDSATKHFSAAILQKNKGIYTIYIGIAEFRSAGILEFLLVGESSAAETTLYIGIGKNIPRQKFREPKSGILLGIIPALFLIP